MERLRVSEAARELGVSAEARLRRPEGRVGVPKARRDVNGWRVYLPEDIKTLRAFLWPGTPDEGHNDVSGGRHEAEMHP